MAELDALIRDEIAQSGPMRWGRLVDLSLYHPVHGFYERGGRAGGRAGDFVTSVEVGPLFAAVIAEWLDQVWDDAGRPAVFRVAEAGAGVGTLWRGIVRAAPRCFDAIEWLLVERSEAQRGAHAELPAGQWASLAELPVEPVHVVVANELLDNLSFDIAEMTPAGWRAVVVDLDANGRLATRVDDDEALELNADAPVGARVPVPVGAAAWLTEAQALAESVLVFDYVATVDELVERGQDGWLRAYANHGRVDDPLRACGSCDITHDVPIDFLPTPTRASTQAEWLRAHGLDVLVAAARDTWAERSHIGDLEAMFARSAVHAGDVLTDPEGLGAFTVLEWS